MTNPSEPAMDWGRGDEILKMVRVMRCAWLRPSIRQMAAGTGDHHWKGEAHPGEKGGCDLVHGVSCQEKLLLLNMTNASC